MQLVEMRENSMMPVMFKPYLDKVIETISECEEPPAQPEQERNYCEGCKHRGMWENEVEYGYNSPCTNCAERASSNYEPER